MARRHTLTCWKWCPSAINGCAVLEAHPQIGRLLADDKRELIIGLPARGYVAPYRYVDAVELVVILAIRAQRERGYARGL
jgi:toxin ParE1/3/4